MTGAAQRIKRLEVRHGAGAKPVFVMAGQAPPADSDPRYVVTETPDGIYQFPPGFVWHGLEQDLDALNAMQEKP